MYFGHRACFECIPISGDFQKKIHVPRYQPGVSRVARVPNNSYELFCVKKMCIFIENGSPYLEIVKRRKKNRRLFPTCEINKSCPNHREYIFQSVVARNRTKFAIPPDIIGVWYIFLLARLPRVWRTPNVQTEPYVVRRRVSAVYFYKNYLARKKKLIGFGVPILILFFLY